MLKVPLIILCLLYSSVDAQDFEFPVNDNGKYEFSEVVQLGGIDKDKLFQNGQKFMKKVKVLKSKKNYYSEDMENYSITNKGSFYVYRLGSVKKGIAGATEYDLTLEIKDGKYRYSLTNFVFNEYKKNRYAKYEPINGKYIPLEAQVGSLSKKEWEYQRQVVYDKSQELIQNLYGEMIYSEKKKKKKEKQLDDW